MVARRQRIASLIKNEAAPGEMRMASGLGLILIKLTLGRIGGATPDRPEKSGPGFWFSGMSVRCVQSKGTTRFLEGHRLVKDRTA